MDGQRKTLTAPPRVKVNENVKAVLIEQVSEGGGQVLILDEFQDLIPAFQQFFNGWYFGLIHSMYLGSYFIAKN